MLLRHSFFRNRPQRKIEFFQTYQLFFCNFQINISPRCNKLNTSSIIQFVRRSPRGPPPPVAQRNLSSFVWLVLRENGTSNSLLTNLLTRRDTKTGVGTSHLTNIFSLRKNQVKKNIFVLLYGFYKNPHQLSPTSLVKPQRCGIIRFFEGKRSELFHFQIQSLF